MLQLFTKNNVSPAKSFVVDNKLFDKSLNHEIPHIRKYCGARMQPCGTPALTGNHSDVWPFSSALWSIKKLSIGLNRHLKPQLN